ncbi:MAG TPA: tripartite tricarboxylate transporter substrate binding protein [Ramlibacter sp.]|uniref:Bug family tripartite tricarboxylate transporter substrate binding protein n=1 Tax=Ramlibacter sp. TaxID=1917967 RepID=UPI002BD89F65|nr:tripartite tricarboxylate transporter substrate binding protein [Ramlibacter sp.]HVZ42341.1 tripartite tricarboxylate transporter substrate binding protein [Ramlibacter sp.]
MTASFTRRAALAVAAGGIALAPFASLAQPAWPQQRPIRLVIPYPPGGLADSFARALAEGLGERLKQSVVVDNKPGGSLIIGTDAVAKSQPDGYTLLLGSVSSLAINTGAFKKLPYDPVKDFAPVSLTFRTPLFLMVAPSVPANNVRELVAYAKANPTALSYASLGYGSSLHLSGELFKTLANIDIAHVPYKGTTSAIPDLLTGRVSMMFDGGALLPQAREGKVKMMAVTSAKRVPALPEVPTMEEAGVPGYEMDFWFGIVAPAGTPAPIVERLSRAIAEVEAQPAFRARLAAFPVQYETTTPQQMSDTLRRDIGVWQKYLHDYKVEPQ